MSQCVVCSVSHKKNHTFIIWTVRKEPNGVMKQAIEIKIYYELIKELYLVSLVVQRFENIIINDLGPFFCLTHTYIRRNHFLTCIHSS